MRMNTGNFDGAGVHDGDVCCESNEHNIGDESLLKSRLTHIRISWQRLKNRCCSEAEKKLLE